ncbi:hypothetical protein Rwratislav_43701 [Rhodococcus wratislaviensis IFP 2016]|nr:hypothetical protein Rwratislav_43701 [Rhodococcus wratislaviensis IFP 2016]
MGAASAAGIEFSLVMDERITRPKLEFAPLEGDRPSLAHPPSWELGGEAQSAIEAAELSCRCPAGVDRGDRPTLREGLMMIVYRPMHTRDAEAMSVACLAGLRLVEIDASAAPSAWVFRFESPCVLTAEGLWRVIASGRVAVTGMDHDQIFGLEVPVDASRRGTDAIGSAVVATAGFDGSTGDLWIEFAGGVRLEILTTSTGYESWTLWRPDGTQLVGTGGGEVVPCAPDGAE